MVGIQKARGTTKLSLTIAFLSIPWLVSCAHIVSLVPDSRWHTIYSLQVPNQNVELEVESVNAPRPNCKPGRIPGPTEIRILQTESFQDLTALPDKPENAKPRDDGIPLKVADSGPYDLTLVGAKRVVPLITGKQLIARTADTCAALRLKKGSDRNRQASPNHEPLQ